MKIKIKEIDYSKIVKVIKEKKNFLLIGLFFIMLLFAYSIYGKYQAANPATPYKIIRVEKRDITKRISVNAEIISRNEVELGSDISGKVTAIYVDVGQVVKAGRMIAKVENSTQRAQVTQSLGALQAANAQMESAKVKLSKVKSGTREEQLRILESTLRLARGDYDNAVQSAHNTITNSYAGLSQSVINGTDVLFINPSEDSPKVNFSLPDFNLKTTLSTKRLDIRFILDRQDRVVISSLVGDKLKQELDTVLSELHVANNFYADLFSAIDKSSISNSAKASDVSIVSSARNTVLQQITAITSARNSINQKSNYIDIAQANLDQAVAGAVEEDIEVAKVAVDVAKASVLSASGNYQAAKSTLDKTYIYSPYTGVIVDIYKEVGEFVSNATPIIKIGSEDKYVSALVSEIDIAKIKTDMLVSLELDAFPGRVFEGTVDFIYPDKKEIMGIVYYEIKVSFTDTELSDFTILPGMSLDMLIPYDSKEDVFAIERSAAKKEAGKYFVEILNLDKKKPIDKKFSKIFFEAGFVGDKYIEVISGLNNGEEIVKFIEDGKGEGKKN